MPRKLDEAALKGLQGSTRSAAALTGSLTDYFLVGRSPKRFVQRSRREGSMAKSSSQMRRQSWSAEPQAGSLVARSTRARRHSLGAVPEEETRALPQEGTLVSTSAQTRRLGEFIDYKTSMTTTGNGDLQGLDRF